MAGAIEAAAHPSYFCTAVAEEESHQNHNPNDGCTTSSVGAALMLPRLSWQACFVFPGAAHILNRRYLFFPTKLSNSC